MEEIYRNKGLSYYRNVREDIISLLPKNNSQKILEIGCGGGNTLVEIKERKLAQEVVGCDLFELENSFQKSPKIDRLIIANLESDNLFLEDNYFDVIIAGDVLEHLVDPWKVISDISKFLKNGGLFIVSLPNFREINTLSKIVLKGRFQYNPMGGIMDKTHLRFFCKKNIIELCDVREFKLINIKPLSQNSMNEVLSFSVKQRLLIAGVQLQNVVEKSVSSCDVTGIGSIFCLTQENGHFPLNLRLRLSPARVWMKPYRPDEDCSG